MVFEFLKNNIKQRAQKKSSVHRWTFPQDNGLKHWPGIDKKYLNDSKIKALVYLAQWLDLKAIGHLRAYLKENLVDKNSSILEEVDTIAGGK